MRLGRSPVQQTQTDPLLVAMAQGGKRLLLGDQVFEYRAGQCLVVADLLSPVTALVQFDRP